MPECSVETGASSRAQWTTVCEQVFVEALVAEASIEALDEAVLHGLSGRDLVKWSQFSGQCSG